MADGQVHADAFAGKGEVVLFGDGAAAQEHLRDYLAINLCVLGDYLALLDNIAPDDHALHAAAATGRELLKQASSSFDQLTDALQAAGFGIFVAPDGISWEPHGAAACVVRRLPVVAKGEGAGNV